MSSKDNIMSRLRSAGVEKVAKPEFKFKATTYPDPYEQLKKGLEAAGAKWVELQPGQTIDDVVLATYPDAKRISSNMPEVKCANVNPDELDDPRTLDGTDVGVLRGAFGVAENGMIWVPLTSRYKAPMFISESLVMVVPKGEAVSNMHEAYARPEIHKDFDYGCFIAGPSKTADIEQALVIGAHGARAVTVIFE